MHTRRNNRDKFGTKVERLIAKLKISFSIKIQRRNKTLHRHKKSKFIFKIRVK